MESKEEMTSQSAFFFVAVFRNPEQSVVFVFFSARINALQEGESSAHCRKDGLKKRKKEVRLRPRVWKIYRKILLSHDQPGLLGEREWTLGGTCMAVKREVCFVCGCWLAGRFCHSKFGSIVTFQPTTDSHHHFLVLLQLSIITCFFPELIYGHLHIVWGKVKKKSH